MIPLQENFIFENGILGNAIPPEYINACKKGFEEAMNKGALIGHPVQGVKVVLTDGQVTPSCIRMHIHRLSVCISIVYAYPSRYMVFLVLGDSLPRAIRISECVAVLSVEARTLLQTVECD